MERDRDGVPFQDDFTENRGPSGAQLDDDAQTERLDPDVDSQADDETLKENVFGVDDPKPKR
ncbi:MAG TPA: hypothetical protein VMD91_17400 [Candidatus Sulfotelmatobacter sp.]|nr:hypothetical protein [Candidatus Sulfotelmatobacter sp.]